jgi:hypothetical protein
MTGMPDSLIAAEVTAAARLERAAAAELQRLGFRIHHVGATLSVDGPEALWTATFGVKFVTRRKPRPAGASRRAANFRQARAGSLNIPLDLRPLITDIAFIEPPEHFSF